MSNKKCCKAKEKKELTREQYHSGLITKVPKKWHKEMLEEFDKDQEAKEKKKENDILYVNDIVSFAHFENEIYLEVEHRDHENNFEKKNTTIIFEAWDVLNCGICDKEEIKKKFIKFVDLL
jgi:hypothetical protein